MRWHPVNIELRRTELVKEVRGPVLVLDARIFNICVLHFRTDSFSLVELLVVFPLDSLGAESQNFLYPVLAVQSDLLSVIRCDEMPGQPQSHHDVDDQRDRQHQQYGHWGCAKTDAVLELQDTILLKIFHSFILINL